MPRYIANFKLVLDDDDIAAVLERMNIVVQPSQYRLIFEYIRRHCDSLLFDDFDSVMEHAIDKYRRDKEEGIATW